MLNCPAELYFFCFVCSAQSLLGPAGQLHLTVLSGEALIKLQGVQDRQKQAHSAVSSTCIQPSSWRAISSKVSPKLLWLLVLPVTPATGIQVFSESDVSQGTCGKSDNCRICGVVSAAVLLQFTDPKLGSDLKFDVMDFKGPHTRARGQYHVQHARLCQDLQRDLGNRCAPALSCILPAVMSCMHSSCMVRCSAWQFAALWSNACLHTDLFQNSCWAMAGLSVFSALCM